ncbi:MAG TPA: cysteine desulfurase [Nitrososphaeraceae archaeon]|nr:cysteine desulfurase [Nitrososphaeraceae archaeon]
MQSTELEINKIRDDFPILTRTINGRPFVYLDNASTTQKPSSVIKKISDYYSFYNSNIHRAVYQVAEEATNAYELTRNKVCKFINATSLEEIIFTRNATEAINLVAYSWGRKKIKKGDIILLSEQEHHSNIVPWQILAKEKKAIIKYLKINERGNLSLNEVESYLGRYKERIKLISLCHMSNALGNIVPIHDIIDIAHEYNIPVLVDGAQSVPHIKTDVKIMNSDFLVFSAHKMLGPTGVGILYTKKNILEEMDPFICGGDMIKEVHKENTSFNDLPYKFEAGTPNIADVIGFSAALDYLTNIGMENVRLHEIDLTKYALQLMTDLKQIKLYGDTNLNNRGGIISFNLGDIHPHDLATILNEYGIAIRSGHHCAQVMMEKLDVSATSRASFYIYNTKEEINIFINALDEAIKLFRL